MVKQFLDAAASPQDGAGGPFAALEPHVYAIAAAAYLELCRVDGPVHHASQTPGSGSARRQHPLRVAGRPTGADNPGIGREWGWQD